MTETPQVGAAEQWRPVVGYEGFYEVSDQGRVRGIDRQARTRSGYRTVRGKLLTATTATTGYPVVTLCRDNRPRQRAVHALVLAAFTGACPPGHEALHGDGDPLNVRLDNLRWGTPAENAADRSRHGTHWHLRRDVCALGHRLGGRNVAAARAARGHRTCRACERGNARVSYARRHYGIELDVKAEADLVYKWIMSGRAGHPPRRRRAPRPVV